MDNPKINIKKETLIDLQNDLVDVLSDLEELKTHNPGSTLIKRCIKNLKTNTKSLKQLIDG